MLTAKHNSHHAAIRTVHKLILYPETHPFSLYILYTLASQQDGSETNPRRPCSWPSALSINKPISTPNSDVLACCTLLFFGHTGTWVWRQWIQPVKEKYCLTPILLSGKIPRTDEPGGLKSMGLQKSQTRLSMCVYPIRRQRTLQPPRHYTYSCPNCEPWGNSGQNKMPTIKSSTTTALPFNPACAYTHTHTHLWRLRMKKTHDTSPRLLKCLSALTRGFQLSQTISEPGPAVQNVKGTKSSQVFAEDSLTLPKPLNPWGKERNSWIQLVITGCKPLAPVHFWLTV